MHIVLPNICNILLIGMILSYNAMKDWESTEIDIPFSLIGFSGCLLEMFAFNEINIYNIVTGFTIGLVPFLALAVFGKCGGGDVIIMSLLGIVIGGPTLLYTIVFSLALYILYGIIQIIKAPTNQKSKILKEQYPFIPFVLGGWCLTVILSFV